MIINMKGGVVEEGEAMTRSVTQTQVSIYNPGFHIDGFTNPCLQREDGFHNRNRDENHRGGRGDEGNRGGRGDEGHRGRDDR